MSQNASTEPISLVRSLRSPLPGGDEDEVWELPKRVGRWSTFVDWEGQPQCHSGGRGYGWVVEDTLFPGQRGFLKRSWLTLEDKLNHDRFIAGRHSAIQRTFEMLGGRSRASSVLPGPLGLEYISYEDEVRSDEPVLIYRYFAAAGRRSVTLKELRNERVALTGDQCERLAVCLAAAFVAMGHMDHSGRLFHGDIKPENVLFDEVTNTFALIDCDEGYKDSEDEEFWPVSTPDWAPPEMLGSFVSSTPSASAFASLSTPSPRVTPCDLWSAAMVLLCSLFPGKSPEELRRQIVENEMYRWELASDAAKEGVWPAICAVIAEGLNPDPRSRLDYKDFVLRLADYQRHSYGR
jgi:hypothetical protein